MFKEVSEELVSFIQKSPTVFHAVENMRQLLINNGYEELCEGNRWNIKAGHQYFVTRNHSSIIAFRVGDDLAEYSFNIAASHGDSPTFKIKENAEIEVRGKYTQLNTEPYGGMISSTWMDRPLSVAGRAFVKDGNRYVSRLVNIDRDLVLIPNVAIHMNREVNNGYKLNYQVDMLPLLSGEGYHQGDFKKLIAESLGVSVNEVYGTDLYLYNRMAPSIWGMNNEFISSSQLDDLQCAFASLKGFLKGYNKQSVNVFVCFDNEEVGSVTKQGAASTFLYDVLQRINYSLGKTEEDYFRAIASSLMLSADNAHAVHPNHPEKTDIANCTYINEGIVVKSHARQKYISDAMSIALFKGYCEKAGVPIQYFSNRSDMTGGSTLGNISSSQVSVNSIDIGLPQLAMHSSYETAGIKDTYYMIQLMEEFFNSHITQVNTFELKVTK